MESVSLGQDLELSILWPASYSEQSLRVGTSLLFSLSDTFIPGAEHLVEGVTSSFRSSQLASPGLEPLIYRLQMSHGKGPSILSIPYPR